ncbi:hypothetical protein COCVIDRAFT_86946 [Bipolaris victoriae FI3]|uniref:Life-span regulatory factor domain-containing protein n=2 Tax=Bipolaris TaxID=33194 RepID=W6Z3R5_COCC2|nr:uncharacterized protein COCCADRAFT_22198 [Bipolaris zeicola 26-R-13]XP_014561325.1 hypothetical protein COCVIDRAFT_86946 [Bipolaris victoriae FI3]EUC38326.1 hypothetical protein COCCADRAFT_22198 [Bipolaris zeicola 26-R-13]
MATHHVRHLSHQSKKSQPPHARPSRPLSKRVQSHATKAASKVAPSKDADLAVDDDDEDSMAVSFLNYCTVCEKQIVVPSNTVLYCSESCKKKDAEKSLNYYYDHYSPPTTPFANFTFDDLAFRDIVPQRSPTQPDSKRSSCAFSDVSSDDNTDDRYQSDASKYLRKFQSAPTYAPDNMRAYRPRYNRASTSQYSTSAAPSLSHTPASSVSYSLPYTPATTRPLPPRTKPSRNGSYGGGKSIDLVTPVTAPSSPKSYSHKSPAVSRTSVSTIEGEIVYAKSPVPEPSVASGSLGRLLASSPRHV